MAGFAPANNGFVPDLSKIWNSSEQILVTNRNPLQTFGEAQEGFAPSHSGFADRRVNFFATAPKVCMGQSSALLLGYHAVLILLQIFLILPASAQLVRGETRRGQFQNGSAARGAWQVRD